LQWAAIAAHSIKQIVIVDGYLGAMDYGTLLSLIDGEEFEQNEPNLKRAK